MKTLIRYIFIWVCLPLLVMGCQKNDVIPEVETGEEKMCEITLQMGGELSAEYSPLTKVTGTWYAFNVKRRENSQVEYQDYLLGFYNKLDIKLYVPPGYQYLIECSSIANTDVSIPSNRRDELGPQYIQFNTGDIGLTDHYCIKYPFSPNKGSQSYYLVKSGSIANRFHTSIGWLYKGERYPVFDECDKYTSIPTLAEGNTSERKRYYGTVEISPSQNGTVTLEMKHAGFGISYFVEGISDGTVAINITKDGKTLLSAEGLQQGATCNPKVFEFIDLTKEAETGAVSVVWTRGNGIVEDLGTSYVSFARNKKNVIRLNLGAASSNASMSLETENAEFLGQLEKDVTLK